MNWLFSIFPKVLQGIIDRAFKLTSASPTMLKIIFFKYKKINK